MEKNTYFLNDTYIKYANENISNNIEAFYNKYLFKNRLLPKNTSIKIEDGNVTLVYSDIDYMLPTFQNESHIATYCARYTSLYSCCFNTPTIKVFLPKNIFNLPQSDFNTENMNIIN